MLHAMFIHIFDGLETRYAAELGAVRAQYPSEKPLWTADPLIVHWEEAMAMLEGTEEGAPGLDDLNTVQARTFRTRTAKPQLHPHPSPSPSPSPTPSPSLQVAIDCYARCPAGHECPKGTSAPHLCDPGTYCEEGSPMSTRCPAGTYSRRPGLRHRRGCLNVTAGFWSPLGSAEPVPCPDGHRCPGARLDTVNIPPGSAAIPLAAGAIQASVEEVVEVSEDVPGVPVSHSVCEGGQPSQCEGGQPVGTSGLRQARWSHRWGHCGGGRGGT